MAEKNKLYEAFQKMAQGAIPPDNERAAIVFAEVTSVSPIAIKPQGFNEEIPAAFIVVGIACRRHFLPNTHIHHGCYNPLSGTETAEIEVWRGLQVGDTVMTFRFNNGQLYYLAERVGMEGFN
ncbi:DUF2577 family protein [Anaerosinus massiliensis]|uniref:DUF2577 family protein n=1 Tax=Massilibacillus massiliensis TaxID=1806837 RepID=UPI000DA622C5|nr:DUF2577 family protein [Massilibacillus massiliensis]